MPGFIEYGKLFEIAQRYRVVVFGGFSGRGYADTHALAALLRRLVAEAGDGTLHVGGATRAGIGMAYDIIPEEAARLGFSNVKTAGIVSHNASLAEIAEQDWVVLVPTPPDDWRVLREGRSLMVDIAAEGRGRLIYFGGGNIAMGELAEAGARGVPATFVTGLAPAAMAAASRIAEAAPAPPDLPGVTLWTKDMDCPLFPK